MGEIERSASPADGLEIAGERESRGCVTFYTIDQSHAISSEYRLDSLTLDPANPSLTISGISSRPRNIVFFHRHSEGSYCFKQCIDLTAV